MRDIVKSVILLGRSAAAHPSARWQQGGLWVPGGPGPAQSEPGCGVKKLWALQQEAYTGRIGVHGPREMRGFLWGFRTVSRRARAARSPSRKPPAGPQV